MTNYKTFFNTKLRSPLTKVLTHGAQGYLFGSMVGLLSKNKLCEAHVSGMRFAKVGMVYAGSEAVLEQIDDGMWTKVASGVVAGSCVNGLRGGLAFGAYSGIVEMFNNKSSENE